ncbi:MAG: pyrroline-5-carboxylate reductase [Fibrobacteraceae bacterium]|nr:pyrroline-5-carboxylate reductase [Fibrobacteraceae bacterium]
MKQRSIFFIGAGNMGGAILKGLVRAGYPVQQISFFEPSDSVASALETLGVKRVHKFSEGYGNADILLLCVKPQIFSKLPAVWNEELQNKQNDSLPDIEKKTVISIMAGVTKEKIRQSIGNTEIVRIMPNLPLTVGKGTIALASDGVSEETLTFAESIFDSVGTTCRVQESWMDAVTGLSGSGPAYVFEFIEGLIRGGVSMGLSREAASKLAISTVEGSVALLKESKKSPADLSAMVSSPGGTTIAGLEVLENNSFRGTLMETVKAATKRSKELG